MPQNGSEWFSFGQDCAQRFGLRRLDAAFMRAGLTGRERFGESSLAQEKRRQAAAVQNPASCLCGAFIRNRVVGAQDSLICGAIVAS
jgi:hypothetical protein